MGADSRLTAMADLTGVLAKLDRAEEHRQAFDDLVDEYVGADPYTIYSQYDPQTGWHTLRWQALREPPLERMALIFGDMVSNLRTTLDYLVWQLVLAAGKRPGRRTGFPVVRRAKDWEVQSRAALNGVRTLAHAEGGGVLYVHTAADEAKAVALVASSLDRLGVCNRLNLLLVDRAFEPRRLLEAVERAGVEVREPPRLGHEWANDAEHVASVTVRVVDSLEDAVSIANEETSGLAAGIVTEDAAAAERFLDGCRGTAVFWHAPTRFTDGFALTGAPETGINVDWVPGPRGPVTYRDLWLRQYRVIGDATQRR